MRGLAGVVGVVGGLRLLVMGVEVFFGFYNIARAVKLNKRKNKLKKKKIVWSKHLSKPLIL